MSTTMRREDLARAVADAVLAVPGVAEIVAGSGVEAATYFAGGKIVGLRMAGEQVQIHIVADRMPLGPVGDAAADAASRVLAAAGDGRAVQIVIEDVRELSIDRRGQS